VGATYHIDKSLAFTKAAFEALQSKQQHRLLSIHNEEALERDIASMTRDITHQLSVMATAVHSLGTVPATASEAQRAIRTNIHRAKSRAIHEVMTQFSASQQRYAEQLRNLQARSGAGFWSLFKTGTSAGAGAGAGTGAGAGAGTHDTDTGFTDVQLAALEEAEVLGDERASEIAEVCASIEQLASLMKHLSVLVVDQGTMLDRVDTNMATAVQRTAVGVSQLVLAEKHQRASGGTARACIAVLIVLTLACLIVLVVRKA
jgi:syntaxin 16